jgi:hypothetical protein
MPSERSEASRLRDDIDRGRTGDKVAWPDPAAAPLGTDDEAGAPMGPDGLLKATGSIRHPLKPPESKTIRGPIPNVGLSRFNDEYGQAMLWLGLAILLATFVLLTFV